MVKVQLITCHVGPVEEYRNSFTLSLTSALDGAGGQRHVLAAVPQGMTQHPFY